MGDPSVQLSFEVAKDIRMVSYVFWSMSATVNLHSSVTRVFDSRVLGPPTGLLSVCILVPFQILHWVSTWHALGLCPRSISGFPWGLGNEHSSTLAICTLP